MGVTSFTREFNCQVSAARMFKALILDSHNLVPKLIPQVIKSIDIILGDGGRGSIKQINFSEGTYFKYMKNRIDVIDIENLMCNYTLFEGDMLVDKLESISYKIKFEPLSEEKCVCKVTSQYFTSHDFEIKEEQLRGAKERVVGMYKIVEAYLFENPAAYS